MSKIQDLLNSSALHKPTTEGGKKRMETDPLLKYIAKNYSGKTFSVANEIKLGAYLGVPVSSKDKVTTAEANKILDAFKNAGFSQGGIVSAINKAVKENGDDGIATVKNGEAILTPKQTEDVKEISENVKETSKGLIMVGSRLTAEQQEYIRQNIMLAHTTADMINSVSQLKQETDTGNKNVQTTNVNVGDVDIHMDGSNVVDKESFRKTLRDYEVRRDIEEIALGDLTSPVRHSLRRI